MRTRPRLTAVLPFGLQCPLINTSCICTQLEFFLQLRFFVSVPYVRANDVSFCIKKKTYPNVVLQGGLEAGKYMPWEPHDVSHMTVDTCTEHCCKSPDTDVVFLLNR